MNEHRVSDSTTKGRRKSEVVVVTEALVGLWPTVHDIADQMRRVGHAQEVVPTVADESVRPALELVRTQDVVPGSAEHVLHVQSDLVPLATRTVVREVVQRDPDLGGACGV